MAAGELEKGGVECVRTEVGPEVLGEVELGIGRLPDQEVGETLLAAGPDHQVWIWQAGRIEARADRAFVDLIGRDAALAEPPERVDKLRTAGVVEGDVEEQPGTPGGGLERFTDGGPGRLRQLIEAAKEPDANTLGAELVGLAADRRLEQP